MPYTTENLLSLFNFESNPRYGTFGALRDCPIGFYVLRWYPENCRFRPAIKPNGEPDTVILIHVIIDASNPTSLTPLRICLSRHSRYRGTGRYDYNFDDPDCPSNEELTLSRSSPQPLKEVTSQDYSLNIANNQFYDFNDRQIDCLKMLDDLVDIHLSTTCRIQGAPLRFKIAIKEMLVRWFAKGSRATEWFLEHILGWRLNDRKMEYQYRG